VKRLTVSIALLLAVGALAGCGSTSGPGQGGGSAETEAGTLAEGGGQAGDAQAPGLRNDPIFHEAGGVCVNLPIELLAQQYGVDATPEAVAKAVASDYPADKREVAEAGCLDVLKEGGRGGEG
jgi:hypothetical protein